MTKQLEFLTADELRELTGYRLPGCQIKWLRDNRWPFQIGGDGRAKVLRQVVLARLGSPATSAQDTGPRLRFG